MMATSKLEIGRLFFEEGLPGFSHLQFFRLEQEEANTPFYSLQSAEEEQVSFWVIDPFPFFPDYQFNLHDQAKRALRIEDEACVTVLNIITLREGGHVTVNLKAPIIINQENRMARQIILNEESYQVRQPLFQMKPAASE